MSKTEKFAAKIKVWTQYWRSNPHRACEDLLNVRLKLFQKIVLCAMNDNSKTVMITCRGLGKTFLTAIFCTLRCILYPGSIVVVASKTRKQSNEVIGKIKNILMPNSPILRTEIEDIQMNQYNSTVSFRNSSQIVVCTASDNSRGLRCHILLVDEFRMVDQNIYNTVLKKFLNVNRQPGFMRKDEYLNYPTEENKTILLSSAYFADNWAYDETRTTSAQMISGRFPYFACALPYQLAIKENLLTRDRVLSEMVDASYSSITFSQEMEAMFSDFADGNLYDHGDIAPCRKIKYAFYPPATSALVSDKRIKIPPKMHNEQRILSADIALMASSKGKNNDATSIFVNQLLLNDNGRSTNKIVYGENNEGLRVEEQALRIRQLFYEYDCDALVIDARGVGIGVLDLLMADIYDPDTGIVYGALSSVNPDIAERCSVKNAPKVIYPVLATAEFNSRSALGLRESFKQGAIQLLVSEDDFDEIATDIVGYGKLSLEDKIKFKLPYMNTTLLINELVSLQYEDHNGVVRVKEKSGMRKDRFSSLSYSVEIGKQLEKEYLSKKTRNTIQDLVFQFRQPVIGKRR
jgi:hypothetical protein